MAEFHNCDSEVLNNTELIEKLMINAADKSGATIVNSIFHTFNPWGVSGAVVITESHLTIHTWPEFGYAAVDVFTCGEDVDAWVGFKVLQEGLKSDRYTTVLIKRGIVNHDQVIPGFVMRPEVREFEAEYA